MPSIEETKNIARTLHSAQVDKTGEPDIGHVMRVFRRVREVFSEAREEVLHATLLHDAIEDCDATATAQ